MQKEIIVTKDGSHSIAIPELQVTYHSLHGSIQESKHVFIEAALQPFIATNRSNPIRVLEVGFGTGLNALLTQMTAKESQRAIEYITIEPFPLEPAVIASLNYCEELNRADLKRFFTSMHECEWDKHIQLVPEFSITKYRTALPLLNLPADHFIENINIIYFDAFAPNTQPELWTENVFKKMFDCLNAHGTLVTYCSKSIVRKAMQGAGFKVEKIPGPIGKREMLRALK